MKKKGYILAFILPILIFCFALFSMNIYPFGKISLRISDALIQYPAFFESLKHLSLFTFNIGLGENYFPTFVSYLNNPLNLLYFFFNKENFDLFYVILVFIKIGLIGLTMNILLNYKKEYNKKSIIFSTIYALSDFITIYYWNYQFLDAVYMLPLIMIGIDKIVNEDKNIMYYLTLTYMIIIHYYTAYMICLFSVIYFFFLLYNCNLKKEDKKKRIIKFFVTSLFCGLTSAYILVPTIFSLFQGRSHYMSKTNLFGINSYGITSLYNFNIGSFYARDYFASFFSVFGYISIFVMLLVILSFFSKKNTKKYKKSVLVVLIIYLLSITFNFFYFGWHLFQEPVGLPGRFVFCFDAFLVLVAYNFYLKNDKLKIKKLLLSISFIIINLALFIYKNFDYNKYSLSNHSLLNFDKVYLILFIANIIIFIYYLYNYNNIKLKYLTYFIVFLELAMNSILNINVNYQSIRYDYSYIDELKQKIIKSEELVNEIKNNSDNNFYRMNFDIINNSALLYNYCGVNRYSSVFNNNLNSFLDGYTNNRQYSHSTSYNNYFLMDALLGLKYIFFEHSDNKYEVDSQINQYIINSLGFAILNKDKSTLEHQDDIVNVLNELTNNKYNLKLNYLYPKKIMDNIREEENVYEIIDSSKDGKLTLIYSINEDIVGKINFQNDYKYIKLDDKDNITNTIYTKNFYKVYINDKEVKSFYKLSKGDTLKIVIDLKDNMNVIFKFNESLEYVNENIFSDLVKELNKNIITDLNIKTDGFEGKLNVDNDKNLLMLTVPYDEGIKLFIDDEEVSYNKCLDGIICLNVNEGDHTIEMKYKIKGFNIGLFISLITFCCFWILKKFKLL